MPSYNRKRKGLYPQQDYGYGSRENPIMIDESLGPMPPVFKKSRPNPPPRKNYVPRTPGGNIVAENHYFDTDRTTIAIPVSTSTWSGAAMDPAGGLLNLCSPTVGDDITQRTARKIFIKKIRIIGTVTTAAQSGAAACDEGVYVRIVVFKDKQTNAAQATGDLVLNSGGANNAVLMYMSPINLGRFDILAEKKILLQAPTLAGLTGAFVQPGQVRPFKFNLKINDYTHFNSTNGGTVADIVDNSYHIIALADNASLAPSIQYKSRAVFSP